MLKWFLWHINYALVWFIVWNYFPFVYHHCVFATFCPTVYLAMMTDHIFYSRISTGNTIRITVSFFLVFLQRNYYHERHGLMHAQNKNDQDRSHRPLTALTISLAVLRIFNTRSSGQALSEWINTRSTAAAINLRYVISHH